MVLGSPRHRAHFGTTLGGWWRRLEIRCRGTRASECPLPSTSSPFPPGSGVPVARSSSIGWMNACSIAARVYIASEFILSMPSPLAEYESSPQVSVGEEEHPGFYNRLSRLPRRVCLASSAHCSRQRAPTVPCEPVDRSRRHLPGCPTDATTTVLRLSALSRHDRACG